MQHISGCISTVHITPPCNKPGEAKGASKEIFDFDDNHSLACQLGSSLFATFTLLSQRPINVCDLPLLELLHCTSRDRCVPNSRDRCVAPPSSWNLWTRTQTTNQPSCCCSCPSSLANGCRPRSCYGHCLKRPACPICGCCCCDHSASRCCEACHKVPCPNDSSMNGQQCPILLHQQNRREWSEHHCLQPLN